MGVCKTSGDHINRRVDFDRADRLRPKTEHRTSLRTLLIGNNREIFSIPCNFRSRIEPDRHAWFEAGRITSQIEAQAQRIAIVIANGTLGLPSRERAQRT